MEKEDKFQIFGPVFDDTGMCTIELLYSTSNPDVAVRFFSNALSKAGEYKGSYSLRQNGEVIAVCR